MNSASRQCATMCNDLPPTVSQHDAMSHARACATSPVLAMRVVMTDPAR